MITALVAAAAAVFPAGSTAYCLHGTMSDGSYTRAGSAAVLPGGLPLGTRIYVLGAGGPGGARRWVVRDHIGHGSELDFWQPTCNQAVAWGRRRVTYRLGWPTTHLTVRPKVTPALRDAWRER